MTWEIEIVNDGLARVTVVETFGPTFVLDAAILSSTTAVRFAGEDVFINADRLPVHVMVALGQDRPEVIRVDAPLGDGWLVMRGCLDTDARAHQKGTEARRCRLREIIE